MRLTAKLALSQIKENYSRSVMTLSGIALSAAMLTAVCGFAASAKVTFEKAFGYEYDNTNYNFTIAALGAVLGSIIVAASIIVVSNAFRVSAGERIRQFGILKSVGATKRQIATSVLYEGIFLSIVGIPIGIAIGLFIELIGTVIITNLLHSMSSSGTLNVDSEAFLTFPFVTPPLMFAIAIITSFGTVLLSAWFPARKAAKIPAIDAIRNADEVKLRRKKVRTSKLTQKIFGFEGVLAAKSLKRSRRSFRATVISLTVSIVLLITAGGFGTMMMSSTSVLFENVEATVVADWTSEIKTALDDEEKAISISYIPLYSETAEIVTEKLREYKNAEIYGIGRIRNYKTVLPNGVETNGTIVSVDMKHYKELCKAAGVPVGSSLLINMRRETVNGIKTEYIPYDFSELANKSLMFSLEGHEPIEVTITGELREKDISAEVAIMCEAELTIIVPDSESVAYTWFVNVEDVDGFAEYAEQMMKDFAPQPTEEYNVYIGCLDIMDTTGQIRYLVNTIMFFVYGFVGMLTLIAVTSVISTINTNIRSRAKEFAVLESVGMTKSGLKRMLNLESLLCSVKSLVFGIPLGLIGTYALYRGMGFSVGLQYKFPLLLITECIIGVFLVTWVTMRYSASRLKGGSIVETIRGE